jgi:hypothetical protein
MSGDKLTPNEAKRKLCVECIGGAQFNSKEVDGCEGDRAKTGPCPIYPYRNGKRMSVKIFRKFCLNCMGGSYDAISECTTENCPAFEYRFGKNPSYTGRSGNAGSKALQKYREKGAGQGNNL